MLLSMTYLSCTLQVFRLRLADETVIAKSLEEVQKNIGPDVSIGSYPVSVFM